MSDLIEIQASGGVWSVRLNRPQTRNAFSLELMRSLTKTAQQLRDEPGVRAVILCAAGPHFSAGMDLAEVQKSDAIKLSLAERRTLAALGERMCQAWQDLPAMTIGAIEGHCIGGGAALAAALDWRVIGSSAWFWLPEIALGLPLGWGALPRLVSLLGPARAKRFIILGERLQGQQALDFGLAEYLVPDGQAEAEALKLAQRVVDLPEVAVTMSKQAVNASANALSHLASHMVSDQLALALASEEALAARARFASNKRGQ
ncbi:MAG: enoyl-CoA hydratase/isomerase family protein [Comamonadaceae bacterium]|jgi:enoyl-CoA hydratase/carnithine racemase|nr:MAG: enoyl-CoA hydratase/isomerase family protein [Comamonadaceae bacterium]